MQKLKLEDLTVESYPTSSGPKGVRGTVHGYSPTLPPNWTNYCFTDYTCEWTCLHTCAFTCYNSCGLNC